MLFVFMSQPDFACNPHALYEYIERHTEHETAWLIKRDEKYYELKKRGIRCASYNTLEGNKLLESADFVIVNSYTFPQIQKREGQIFVNLWHGSGIKAHDFYNHDMDMKHARNIKKFSDMIDLMCVHSLDDRFKLSAQLNFDLRKCFVTGQARLDCVKTSHGIEKIKQLFGDKMQDYKKLIFFAPSFRANGSSHSGTIFSDNIFRAEDYDAAALDKFLQENQAALIYKLHPIEQTAFSGRQFHLSEDCYELTDQMLFEKDIRYDELLNAFDVMISDYSSIAFDFLFLNRPIVYLIPDYEEYVAERGFVFHNVDMFMPGQKAFGFMDMVEELQTALEDPNRYKMERELVLSQRFDFYDDQSAKRCFETIVNFKKLPDVDDFQGESEEKRELSYPTTAELLSKWIPKQYEAIDSTKEIPERFQLEIIRQNTEKKYLYITEEIPRELRKLTGRSTAEILDIAYYYDLCKCRNVQVCHVGGGVDYELFSASCNLPKKSDRRRRIGFAGTIDNRIYFSMVQCICEVFSDFDIIFAGELTSIPVWMGGFENLHYVPASYEELPEMIQTFEVAILPFFGRHKETVPKEYFQYLACGKQVVASDMANLPETDALYRSKSIGEAVDNIKKALLNVNDTKVQESARMTAKMYGWEKVAKKMLEECEA